MAGMWDIIKGIQEWGGKRTEQRKAGEGAKPWWVGQSEWDQRQAKTQIDKLKGEFGQWSDDFDYEGKVKTYQDQMNALEDWSKTGQPTFNPTQWSDYQGRYSGYQNSLDSLLSQIQAGPTAADDQAALDKMLKDYGLTPEQWAQIQASQMTSAEDVKKRAETMAFDPNSEANKNFEAAIRSQQRAAEAGMGKQLETIFADRGGLGGFAAAQDYTLQMSDQMLQQRSAFMTSQMQEAVQMINQDLGRKMNILQAGVDDKRAYLDQRWSQLQQAFQNTAYMADQVMNEFTTVGGENRANYETNLNAFMSQFQTMKDVLITQMGVDQATMDMYQKLYEMKLLPYLDALAMDLSGGQ